MKHHGPWKIQKSRTVYTNPWLSVREDSVLRPDGSDGIFGVVEMVAGAAVLPLDTAGNVYLTKEFRYAIGAPSIEVVSGGIEPGETPLQAGKRELREELGMTAQKWTSLGILDPFTSVVNSPASLFLVENLHFSETRPDATEIITSIKLPLTKAVELVMQSKITHGQTSVLILKAYVHVQKKRYTKK